MLKVAIIGLGTISSIHRYAIENDKRVSLVAVCDIDESKKAEYVDIPFYSNIDDMLSTETLDCVHICLPHYLHAPVVSLCAKKGVHIFTEKPVALSYNEATTLFDLEKAHGVKIGVCLQNRYNETTIVAKKLIENQKYGKFIGSKGIVTWGRTIDYYNENKWRGIMCEAGGGVMINQTVHTLDLLQYIAGSIKSISGMKNNFSLKETEIEDTVCAYVKYNDGATGVFFGTIAFCTNSSVEMEFVCEKGTIKMRDNKLHYHSNEGEIEFLCEDEQFLSTKQYYGAGHKIAIESFYSAIIHNTDEYISLQEGAKAVKIIDKIVLSSDLNKEIKMED